MENFPPAQEWLPIWRLMAGPSGQISTRVLAQGMDEGLRQRIQPLASANPFLQAPEFRSRNREVQWAEGRRCYFEVWESLGAQPRLFSLSHTGDRVLALGASSESGFEGVGVDVERAHRPVQPSLDKKIRVEGEQELALSSLELWVIKEACFKANPRSRGTLLSDYSVMGLIDVGTHGPFELRMGVVQCSKGEVPFEFPFILVKNRGWLVAFAGATRPGAAHRFGEHPELGSGVRSPGDDQKGGHA